MSESGAKIPSFEALYAQIEALPQGITGEILEPGVIRTTPRPGKAHRRVARRCLSSLEAFDTNVGGTGWWIEVEAEIRLPDGRLTVPDLVGFGVERVSELPDENPLVIVPDWCCEVLSLTTGCIDIGLKLPLYARSGVTWVWILDPVLRLVEIFETVDGRATLAETAQDNDRKVLAPFDGEIAVGSWWPPT